MTVLSPDVISQVAYRATEYSHERWNPSTKESMADQDRLALVTMDLVMLDEPVLGTATPALPGRDEAMYVVLSDLAIKAAELMRRAPESELNHIGQADATIALDPIAFDHTPDQKRAEAEQRERERIERLEHQGSPPPSLIDRGPLPLEAADRVAEIAMRAVDGPGWKVGNGMDRYHHAQMHADRLARLERNRRDVTDPDLRAAYDLMQNDHAIKAAEIVTQAILHGELRGHGLKWKDERMLRDPHNPAEERGLSRQAAGLGANAPAPSKGPREAAPLISGRGIER